MSNMFHLTLYKIIETCINSQPQSILLLKVKNFLKKVSGKKFVKQLSVKKCESC